MNIEHDLPQVPLDGNIITRRELMRQLYLDLSDPNRALTKNELREALTNQDIPEELQPEASDAIVEENDILNALRGLMVRDQLAGGPMIVDDRLDILREVIWNSRLFMRTVYPAGRRIPQTFPVFRRMTRRWGGADVRADSVVGNQRTMQMRMINRLNTYIFRLTNLGLHFHTELTNDPGNNSNYLTAGLQQDEVAEMIQQMGRQVRITRRGLPRNPLRVSINDLLTLFFSTVCNIIFVPETEIPGRFPILNYGVEPILFDVRILLVVSVVLDNRNNPPNGYEPRRYTNARWSQEGVSYGEIVSGDNEIRRSPFFVNAFREVSATLASRFHRIREGENIGSDVDLSWYIFDSFALNVYISRSEGGGCDSRRHVKVHQKYQYTIRRISPRATFNNCGISCFIMFFLQLLKSVFFTSKCTPQIRLFARKKPQTWRREILQRDDHFLLLPNDLIKIGIYFNLSLTIFDEEMVCIAQHIIPTCLAHIKIVLEHQHYTLLQNLSVSSVTDIKTCLSCGKNIMGSHVCVSERSIEEIRAQQDAYMEKISNMGDASFVASDSVFRDVMMSLVMGKTHILLHAAAGYGKTFLLRKLIDQWDRDSCNYLITASTGIAASLIGGHTIHSALRLNVEKKGSEAFYKQMRALQFLIIDEISMIDSSTFARMDTKLREYRGNLLPFGGVQLVMSGDCLQLPPISNKVQSYFFFQSYVYRKMSLSLFVPKLTVNYRQSEDMAFARILDHCRIGELSPFDIDLLRSRMIDPPDNTPYFCPHRKDVVQYNMERLHSIPGELLTIKSEDDFSEKLSPDFNLDRTIYVKKNAFMIITRNIPEKKVCNGTFCIFDYYDAARNEVHVYVEDRLVVLERIREIVMGNTKKLTRRQFPLRLSWALTIHKCQGMTLDRAYIDIGSNIFTSGQTYVALSRVRRLDNLYVRRFDPMKVTCNPIAKSFATSIQSGGEHLFESSSNDMLCMEVYDNQMKYLEIQDKKTKKKMLNKVIFYDFETYDTQSNSGIQPYFNYLQYYQNDTMKDEKMFLLHENSEDVMTSTFDLIIQWMLEDDERYERLTRRGSFAGRHARHSPIFLCAYNGSNFDFHWFFQYLLRSSQYPSHFYSKQIFKGSSIVFMQIISSSSGRVMLQTHDICQILTSTLQSAVFDFCGSRLKGVFPHKWVNTNGPRAILENKGIAIQLDWDDFYESQQDEVRLAISQGDIHMNCFRIYKELIDYGKKDVIILQQLYDKVNDLTQELFSCNIFDFITASSLSFYGFMRHAPPRMRIRSSPKKIRLDLMKLTRTEETFVRDAIYGGRTLPRIHEWISRDIDKQYSEIEDYYVYLDISGMYVSAMRENHFPYGIHQWLIYESDTQQLENIRLKLNTGKYTLKNIPMFIARVSIEFNQNDLEPSSPYRLKARDNAHQTNLIWGVQNQQEVTYSSVLLYQLCLRGAKVGRIHKCMIWGKKCKMFEKWMDFTLQVKNAGGSATRKFGKILGNATYGSMMKHDHSEVVRIVETNKQLEDFHKNYEWTDLIPTLRKFIIKGKPLNETSDEKLCSRPIFLSAFILDYTKCMVDDFVERLMGPLRYTRRGVLAQPLYGDTDSLVVHASQLPRVKEFLGTDNGFWSDELLDDWNYEERRFGKIIEWVGSAPKSYGLQYRLPHKLDIQQKVKFKGIPRKGIEFIWNDEVCTELTLPILRDCVVNGKSLEILIKDRIKKHKFNLSKEEQMQGIHMFSLSAINLRRTIFKTHNPRRKVLSDIQVSSFVDVEIRKQFPGQYSNVTIPLID